MKFSGIIFDFNGVLLWDTHLQEKSWKQFSKTIRGKALSADEISVHVHGRNNQHTLEYLTGNSVPENKLARLIEQKETIYRRLCLEQGAAFQLSPGAIELLEYLGVHKVAFTIATASGKTNRDFFAAHLHLGEWFDVSKIVYDDGSRPGKPAPDIYCEAARRLELSPEQCVVVEDSRAGIAAAYAAGIGYIVGLGPRDKHQQLSRLQGVDQVITSLEEIPKAWFE